MRRHPLIYRWWFEVLFHAVVWGSLLTLASCASAPQKIEVPKTVEVVVDRTVPLDPELTKDCMDTAPTSQQLKEAIRLANARKEYLDECTSRMRRIRALQPKAVP